MRIVLLLAAIIAVFWLALDNDWLPPLPEESLRANASASGGVPADATLAALPSAPLSLEDARPDIRDVTPGNVFQMPLPEGKLVRLPAVVPPPPPARRTRPGPGIRAQIEAAGILAVGNRRVRLIGIEPTLPEQQCDAPNGRWPCGAFARTALQRLVRQRALQCEEDLQAVAAETSLITRCMVSGRDIGQWLVEQGWVRANAPQYQEAEREARKEGRGIWGPGPLQGENPAPGALR